MDEIERMQVERLREQNRRLEKQVMKYQKLLAVLPQVIQELDDGR